MMRVSAVLFLAASQAVAGPANTSTLARAPVAFLVSATRSGAAAGGESSFTLRAEVVAAGGGDAVGGSFSSSVTIGQPVADAWPMSGGAFEAATGFWPVSDPAPRADPVFASGFE